MATKKTLSNWLTNKYVLIVRNEENLSEKSSFNFTYARLFLFSFIFLLLLLLFSLYLARTLLAQWFDPNYATLEANKKLILLSMKVDSLAYEVERKDAFINNFKSILIEDFEEGSNTEVQEPEISSRGNPLEDAQHLPPIDSQLRVEFEQEGESFLGLNLGYRQELDEIFFFSPISGIVTSPFNLKIEHYGVDIVARTDEPVKSVADGSVILASWTQDSGYVIAIQHRNNVFSVYKHNAALLKKVGNFVSAGEIIAIIGNTGELTTGPHLHFELWHNGNPVNPEDFVSF